MLLLTCRMIYIYIMDRLFIVDNYVDNYVDNLFQNI